MNQISVNQLVESPSNYTQSRVELTGLLVFRAEDEYGYITSNEENIEVEKVKIDSSEVVFSKLRKDVPVRVGSKYIYAEDVIATGTIQFQEKGLEITNLERITVQQDDDEYRIEF